MKKLLLSVAFVCVASISTNAQTTLSQTGGATPTTSTIYCASSSGGQATGIYATSYYRSYTMAAATKIVSVKVGNIVNLATGTGAPTSFPITVKLYKSNGAFPASAASGLTQIATVNKSLPKSAVNGTTLVPSTANVDLTIPVAVAAGDIIVVEVSHETVNGGLFLMGAVGATATGTSGYMKSATCSIATPTDISTINVGNPPAPANGKIVLDLVENAAASSEQFFAENFTLYPNPTTDVLNISSKNGLNASEIRITDLSGKVVKVQKDASTVNVSDLSAGTYLIDITTKEGKATSKFIKK